MLTAICHGLSLLDIAKDKCFRTLLIKDKDGRVRAVEVRQVHGGGWNYFNQGVTYSHRRDGRRFKVSLPEFCGMVCGIAYYPDDQYSDFAGGVIRWAPAYHIRYQVVCTAKNPAMFERMDVTPAPEPPRPQPAPAPEDKDDCYW